MQHEVLKKVDIEKKKKENQKKIKKRENDGLTPFFEFGIRGKTNV